MSKKQQLCAYCGKSGSRKELTREHFVPRCLWEGKRPNQTLTVPVHKKCNEDYAKDDEFFRTALVCMNGTEKHTEAQKVLQGSITRVMKTRSRLFMDHVQKLEYAEIESPAGLYLGKALTFKLNVKRFFRIIRKIVLGLYYCKIGKPLVKSHAVHIAWDNQYTYAVMQDGLKYMSPILSFGDDVFIYRWIQLPGDDRVTFWCLGFYKSVSLFAATLKNDGQEEGGALHMLNVPKMSVWHRG
jgi:hypothetical protein